MSCVGRYVSSTKLEVIRTRGFEEEMPLSLNSAKAYLYVIHSAFKLGFMREEITKETYRCRPHQNPRGLQPQELSWMHAV